MCGLTLRYYMACMVYFSGYLPQRYGEHRDLLYDAWIAEKSL